MATERALLDEINRSIGTLTERVDGLRNDMAESRADSRENRERVYHRLEESEAKSEEAVDRLAKLETATAATAARVAEIEPTIEAFTRLQQRGIGAMAIIGLAATLIGGVVAIKWDALSAWLRSWFPGSS